MTEPDGTQQRPTERAEVSAEVIRRIEQEAGRLATQSVARMDERLPWFRTLPADQRSWVALVAQAGLQSYVAWLRSPDDVLRLTGEVFAAAPRAMARSVTLQQAVELVRETITVAEQQLPLLAGPRDAAVVREELLRFSREIAFAAARVYAQAAENRGSWDDRLEALVIDNLVRGTEIGEALPSQLAALGWRPGGPILTLVGHAPDTPAGDTRTAAHRLADQLQVDLLAGVHGGRLVLVVGGLSDAASGSGRTPASIQRFVPLFGAGPIVLGPVATTAVTASAATRTALAGLRAAPGWPAAPRPVPADELLPERSLAGDVRAREALIERIYRPLAAADASLLQTVTAFLDHGGALEATARSLFVHVNTVRYRLRRVAELCGAAPTEPRGAFELRLAIVLGRIDEVKNHNANVDFPHPEASTL